MKGSGFTPLPFSLSRRRATIHHNRQDTCSAILDNGDHDPLIIHSESAQGTLEMHSSQRRIYFSDLTGWLQLETERDESGKVLSATRAGQLTPRRPPSASKTSSSARGSTTIWTSACSAASGWTAPTVETWPEPLPSVRSRWLPKHGLRSLKLKEQKRLALVHSRYDSANLHP